MWLVFDLILQSTLVLLASEVLCYCMGSHAPAFRHRLRLAGVILVFLLPIFAIWVPQFSFSARNTEPASSQIGITTRSLTAASPDAQSPRQLWLLWVWTLGVALRLSAQAAGHIRMFRMLRRSKSLDEPQWNSVVKALATQLELQCTPKLSVSSEVNVPVVCGLRRARVIFPPEYYEWSEGTRRSVLAHELAHIVRGDLKTRFAVSFIASVWWFQPLLLLAIAKMRRDSELACDRMAVELGITASDYAADLIDIARRLHAPDDWRSAAIAMANANDFEDRIRRLIAPSSAKPLQRTTAISLCLLFTATVAASAIANHPKHNVRNVGGTMIRRILPGALLTSVGMSAATIGGTLYTQSGEAINNANAVLYNPDTGLKEQSTSDGSGRISFEGLAPGQYILRIEKAGWTTLFRQFAVEADSHVEKGMTMTPGAGTQATNAAVATGQRSAAAQPDNSGAIRIGNQVAQANLVRQVPPVYPQEAKRQHIQGVVKLEILISREGVPLDIRVLTSPSDDFSQSAIEAVRQWRYTPVLLNGQPVEVATEITINYSLTQ